MAGKTKSAQKSKKDAYSAYKASGRYEKNRARRLSKHLVNHPNDEVAQTATKKISYRRTKPNNDLGFSYSAFKYVDKKMRSEQMVTKSQCHFWAFALKLRKKTENEMRHLPKDVRRQISQEKERNERQNKKK